MADATFKALIAEGFGLVPGLRRTVNVIRPTASPSYDTATGTVTRTEATLSLSVIFVSFREEEVSDERLFATDRRCLIAGSDLPSGVVPNLDWRIEDTLNGDSWEVYRVHPIPAVVDADVAMWRLFLRRT